MLVYSHAGVGGSRPLAAQLVLEAAKAALTRAVTHVDKKFDENTGIGQAA